MMWWWRIIWSSSPLFSLSFFFPVNFGTANWLCGCERLKRRDPFYPSVQVSPFSLVSFWLGLCVLFCFCFSFFYSWALALCELSFPHLPLPTHTNTHTIFTEIGLAVCIVTPLSFLLTASSSLFPFWKIYTCFLTNKVLLSYISDLANFHGWYGLNTLTKCIIFLFKN